MPTLNTSPINESVAAELRAHAARKNITGRNLADRLELPAMWVSRRLSATVAISVDDLVTLSDGIGVYPLDVLAQALTAIGEEPATAAATP